MKTFDEGRNKLIQEGWSEDEIDTALKETAAFSPVWDDPDLDWWDDVRPI